MNANKERARELFAKAFSLDPQFKPTFGKRKLRGYCSIRCTKLVLLMSE